jgi:hypothetical protein
MQSSEWEVGDLLRNDESSIDASSRSEKVAKGFECGICLRAAIRQITNDADADLKGRSMTWQGTAGGGKDRGCCFHVREVHGISDSLAGRRSDREPHQLLQGLVTRDLVSLRSQL